MRNEVIVRDDTARRLFPAIEVIDYRTAVERALAELNAGHVESTWSDALAASSVTRRRCSTPSKRAC